MKLARLRLSNFRCFGPVPTMIDFMDMTFILGPNGAGKTSALQALAKLFSIDPVQRRIKSTDFHEPILADKDSEEATRTLWIEADFEFTELKKKKPKAGSMPAVASFFSQLTMTDEEKTVRLRVRLTATLEPDGEIEEQCVFVTRADEEDEPAQITPMGKQDRNRIQVHYLPARRNPADHISFSTNALIGRALRAANWVSEREVITDLTAQIGDALVGNAAITSIDEALGRLWKTLHKGTFYAAPAVSFGNSEIENLLRHLSVCFTPGHAEAKVDFSRLSDGQQSLLYVSLVLAMHDLGAKVLTGKVKGFDVDKLRPPAFTLLAVEEPENSLSPHYLGRVIRTLEDFASGQNAQAVVATHAPSLLRRVEPEAVRHLRLNNERLTIVSPIAMPTDNEEARKYVREAIQAFPELYFSRFVILGEGDSEEIVLPRLLAARGILADDSSVSIVPLGGRHVNHFWRLLNGLGIPHATLLDLDLARHEAGWWRIRYAARQLRLFREVMPTTITVADISDIPKWSDAAERLADDNTKWIERLEGEGVFFSQSLDLDFMMLEHFAEAYGVDEDEREVPTDKVLDQVLGEGRDKGPHQYTSDQLELFGAYVKRFKNGSKPGEHIKALAELDDDELREDMPEVLKRLIGYVDIVLEGLPE